MKYIVIIHLINEEKIIINNDYDFMNIYLNEMNDGNSNLKIANYIIPKSSINYIEQKEIKESE